MLKIFVFIDIWFVKQDIQKWLKNKDMQVFMENLKMKRKKDKKFLTFRTGDLNPRFSVIFPPMIWIFMGSEDDEIKCRHGSYNFSTLGQIPSCRLTCRPATIYTLNLVKDSYRNGRNTPPLILENLKPIEIIKKSFQHHLNILRNV